MYIAPCYIIQIPESRKFHFWDLESLCFRTWDSAQGVQNPSSTDKDTNSESSTPESTAWSSEFKPVLDCLKQKYIINDHHVNCMDKSWGNNKLLIVELISRLKPLTQHYFDSTVVGALTNNYVEKLFCYLFILGTIQLYTTADQNRGITSQSYRSRIL